MTRHSPIPKHRATVEWDGRYWVATPESGGVTQARRLDQLPARLAEVIHLMTGEDVVPSDIDLDIRYDDDLVHNHNNIRLFHKQNNFVFFFDQPQ